MEQAKPKQTGIKNLVIRSQLGDMGAFTRLVRAYQRTAATLCYVDGCNISEIADFLGITTGTVRKRLYDARKNISLHFQTEDVMKVEQEMAKLMEYHLSPKLVLDELSPEEAVAYLNEYLEAMYQVVLDHDGFMDKVIGDEIMAFWGAPLPSTNHAEVACDAALAMQAKLGELRQEWKKQGKHQLEAAIGMNTGDAIIGNFGPSDQLAYTPMGNSINLAARVERETRRYDVPIVITEFTNERLGKRFVTKELGEIKIKTQEDPIKVFALLGSDPK